MSRAAATRSEHELVRRAWIRLALQSTLAVATVLALVGAIAAALVIHDERAQVDRLLREAIRPAARDDVTDPPPGLALFLVDRAGRVLASTPGVPARLFDRRGLAATAGRPARTSRTLAGSRYRFLTVVDRGGWAQVALDLRAQDAERRRLLGAALVAGLAGMLAAGLAGALLARRAVAPLGEAIQRQSRFVTDASHELRTPLTLLYTRAQLAGRDLRNGDLERVREAVTALARDAGRMGEVVEDLLVSAELGGGYGERAVVDVSAIAREAADAVRDHAEAVGVAIVTDLRPARVEGVSTALRRVVASLLDNAVDHAGRPAGKVCLAVSATPREVVLEVGDDGAGFDPAMAEQLFDRFSRASQAGARRRFGLGLALVREVVGAHGGRVEAEGRPGQGARFRVRLPAAR